MLVVPCIFFPVLFYIKTMHMYLHMKNYYTSLTKTFSHTSSRRGRVRKKRGTESQIISYSSITYERYTGEGCVLCLCLNTDISCIEERLKILFQHIYYRNSYSFFSLTDRAVGGWSSAMCKGLQIKKHENI